MDSLMKYINRIHRCAGQYRSMRLTGTDLNSHQHIYIFHICRNPGISQYELAKRICVNKSNVTRQLNTLEKSGYIIRRIDQNDHRLLRVFPTDSAKNIYPDVLRIMGEWNNLLLSELSESEKELFITLLKRLTDCAVKSIEYNEEVSP